MLYVNYTELLWGLNARQSRSTPFLSNTSTNNLTTDWHPASATSPVTQPPPPPPPLVRNTRGPLHPTPAPTRVQRTGQRGVVHPPALTKVSVSFLFNLLTHHNHSPAASTSASPHRQPPQPTTTPSRIQMREGHVTGDCRPLASKRKRV
jgi:hypothetical protein